MNMKTVSLSLYIYIYIYVYICQYRSLRVQAGRKGTELASWGLSQDSISVFRGGGGAGGFRV